MAEMADSERLRLGRPDPNASTTFKNPAEWLRAMKLQLFDGINPTPEILAQMAAEQTALPPTVPPVSAPAQGAPASIPTTQAGAAAAPTRSEGPSLGSGVSVPYDVPMGPPMFDIGFPSAVPPTSGADESGSGIDPILWLLLGGAGGAGGMYLANRMMNAPASGPRPVVQTAPIPINRPATAAAAGATTGTPRIAQEPQRLISESGAPVRQEGQPGRRGVVSSATATAAPRPQTEQSRPTARRGAQSTAAAGQSWRDLVNILPKDQNGSPDVEQAQRRMIELFNKNNWNALTPEERAILIDEFTAPLERTSLDEALASPATVEEAAPRVKTETPRVRADVNAIGANTSPPLRADTRPPSQVPPRTEVAPGLAEPHVSSRVGDLPAGQIPRRPIPGMKSVLEANARSDIPDPQTHTQLDDIRGVMIEPERWDIVQTIMERYFPTRHFQQLNEQQRQYLLQLVQNPSIWNYVERQMSTTGGAASPERLRHALRSMLRRATP